jgi:hypothetical protein
MCVKNQITGYTQVIDRIWYTVRTGTHLLGVADPDLHHFRKLDPDPDPHHGDKPDSERRIEVKRRIWISINKNGAMEGRGRSQMRAWRLKNGALEGLFASGRKFSSLRQGAGSGSGSASASQ